MITRMTRSPELHYTLNRSDATRTIFDSLGIPRQRNKEIPIA